MMGSSQGAASLERLGTTGVNTKQRELFLKRKRSSYDAGSLS